jgi:hypothetical protein
MEKMTDYWCPLTSAFVVVRRAPEAPVLIMNPRATYIDRISVVDLEDARRSWGTMALHVAVSDVVSWTEELGALLPPRAGNETTRKETKMDMNVGQCAGQAEGPANVITKGLGNEVPGERAQVTVYREQVQELEDGVRRLRESLRRRDYDYDEACRTIARQDGVICALRGQLRTIRNAVNVAK